jgi:phosphodiesterase/alkaline phosphatase D-like protein
MNDDSRLILGPLIGGLTHERVNLWARAASPGILYAWLATKQDLSDARQMGMTPLDHATGFAGIVSIEKLQSASKYYFGLTLDPKLKPANSAFRSFTTFPAPGEPKSFRFAFGSCFRPEKHGAGRAFKHMSENQPDLAFLLMLGDQIYADDWNYNGLGHVAQTLDDYRAVYRHTWSNANLRTLLASTPVFMILDDHEVDNDWCWKDISYQQPSIPFYTRFTRWLQYRPPEERNLTLQRVRAALQANWEHQVMHAPALLRPNGPLAYSFQYGATAFFVMDTRTKRVLGRSSRFILDEAQWQELTNWLKLVNKTHPIKFIVTSIALLSHITGDRTADRWDGFREQRDRLLHFLAAEEIKGVYFLAGDLHSAHSISANVIGHNGRLIPIREFCSSPFEQVCNRFAWLLDHPIKSPALRNQKMQFVAGHINYGVLYVDFTKPKDPHVSFELYYEKDGDWLGKMY